ncbi:MAG: CRISPR-associated endonuclease Cas2 [Deltaproteobacteria bacterium]|nr:MAG: CRISPR-associated endonuclease Cas2 [Deltaproteobacteria bacterium]
MRRRWNNIIVSYDIHDSKRLQKVGKVMKDYGERVLYSVFECRLSSAEFARMKDRIDEVIDHMEDSVRFYFVCDKCVKNVLVSGQGSGFLEESNVIIA